MNHTYRAFISYRHTEQDIAVASYIQRALEHYPVPRQVWLKTGRKKIGRIFRDKEELSVTKDLNETLEKALNNAEFLIVICSPEAKQSKWVLKEIEFFLRTHSRDKVLTVLASGEPMDVIPEILLTGQGDVQYEPLSCDFRRKSRSVRRTELTRMAAVLLGCSYDELAMRERQYRRKRLRVMLAGILAVLSIALVYLLWSRQAIRRNYDIALNNYEVAQQNLRKAKLNQSSALAEYANALLKDGDRLRATLLCLEALPSTADQRPFSPAAFNTLAKAVGAYIPRGRRTGTSEMVTTAEFSAQNRINGFGLSDSSRYLYVHDGDGNIYVWDLTNNKKAFEIYQPSSSLRNVFFLPDERLAVCTADHILVYGMDSAEPALTIDISHLKDWAQRTVCNPEGNIAMAYVEGYWDAEEQKLRLLEFDSHTGEILTDTDLGTSHGSYIQRITMSPGGQYAVIVYFESESYMYHVLVYDRTWQTSRKILTDESLEEINALAFTDETHLAVLHSPNDGETSSVYDSTRILWKEDVSLELLDLQNQYRRWISSFRSVSFNHVPEDNELFLCDTPDENGEATKAALLAVHANTAALFDLETGKLLNENETSSTIIMVRRAEDGTFQLLMENGDVGLYNPLNPGHITEETCYSFNIIQAKEGPRGSLLLQPSQNTLWLSTFVWDDTFTRLSDVPLPSVDLLSSAVIGETLVVMDSDQTILQYDLANAGTARTVRAADEGDLLQWIGADEESVWLGKHNIEEDTSSLVRVKASDGSVQELKDNRYNDGSYYFSMENKRLCIKKGGYYGLYSAQDGKLKEEFLLDLGESDTWIYPDPKHNKAVLIEMEPEGNAMKGACLYDIRSGTREQLEFPMRGAVNSVLWNAKGSEFLLDYTYGLFLMDGSGTLISHIEEIGQESTAKCFLDNSLLVLFTGGHLNRYSTADGHLISQTALTNRKDDFLMSDILWIRGENSLVLQPSGGVLPPLYILETEGFEEVGYSRFAIGYDAARNRILSFETDPQTGKSYVGYFTQHTVYSLRDKARRVLDGMRLTDEERSRYALD